MRENHKPDNLEYSRNLEDAKKTAARLKELGGKIKIVKTELEKARKIDAKHNYTVQDLKNRHMQLLNLNNELDVLNEEFSQLLGLLQQQAMTHNDVEKFLKNFSSEYIN
jgi:hypothetical protein